MAEKEYQGDYIKFIGTAGARVVVTRQLRASGGAWLHLSGKNLLLDPGPGCLVRCLASRPKLDPSNLDAIILSHRHLDHAGDANIMIEAMTEGGFKKRGALFATFDSLYPLQEKSEGASILARTESAGHGSPIILKSEPVVFSYVQKYLSTVEVLKENSCYQLEGLKFRTGPVHRHPVETYGLVFYLGPLSLAIITDTAYFPELEEFYRADILMMNVVRHKPHPSHEVYHLCADDVRKLITATKPRVAVMTHFGMTMLQAKPWELAESLSEETGVKVIAARDGMTLTLADIK